MHEPPGKAAAHGARAITRLLQAHGPRIALLFAGVLLPLWVFAELAEEVHALERFVFDDPLLLRAHAYAGPATDRFFLWMTRAGYQYGVIPLDITLLLALLVVKRWREATFAGVAVIGSALLNMGAKQFFARVRPSLWESISPESSFSFPSGHAMGSMTLVMTLVLLAWPTRWRWPVTALAMTFALLVGISRVYLGVHYPSDVIGGWVAAVAWVVGVYLALFWGPRRPWAVEPSEAQR